MDFTRLPAYEVIKDEEIADVQSHGYLLRHLRSGARIMLLENEDENKVFSIAFRTTPENSTGVAHIMEHTVLCGSRKFPAKDPFVELVKGSMNTFLNAMTYPDKTVFPVASCNDRDFANLMDVYLDAVFFPNIYKKKEIFRQEGWHYELDDPGDELIYNGVVYNEMKGAFSSPDDVVEREIMNCLFPDTTYHHESGGDPAVIPELSYEEYLDFHRKYYHPSNSYIYLYGRMDFAERLEWLDREYLCHFEEKQVNSAVGLQKPFDKMQTVYRKYPVSAGDSEEDKTYLTMNYAVGTSLDTRLASACAVLEYVLLDAPAAPLKEALLQAGIGQDVLGSYDSGTYQPVFGIMVKNANSRDEETFVRIIKDTLSELVRKGLDEKSIRAAINMMEFRFREADYGNYPKGLIYGLDVFDSWLYDDTKPFDYLRQLEDFAFLKEQIGTGYYENIIRTCLLENPHAVLLVVEPERGLTAKTDQLVREKLAALKASMSREEVERLISDTRELRLFQETPSTQEELETIPMLGRGDLKKNAAPLKNTFYTCGDAWIVHHDYHTNGIAYLSVLFDASDVSPEELPYLGVLKNILSFVDTAHYSYGELCNEINMVTGGIVPGLSVFPDGQDTGKARLALGIQVRTLYDQIGFCFRMIEEILFTSNLSQEKRILEILRKLKSRTGVHLSEAGSATASMRALSGLSASQQLNDLFGGVRFYEAVKEFEASFETDKEKLFSKLKSVLGKILNRKKILISYTGDESILEEIGKGIAHLTGRLDGTGLSDQASYDGEQAGTEPGLQKAAAVPAVEELLPVYQGLSLVKCNEGIQTPGKVQYVARCGNFRMAGFDYTGALRVLRTIMSYEYLWSNIRVIGGAYGCSGQFLRNGDTSFVSYRDPQLRKTIEVYEGIPAYLETFTVDERDMTKYVIGTISGMDTPLNPSANGSRSMHAWINGISQEQLQREREQVLEVTEQDIQNLAPLTRAVLSQNYLCVLGNEDRIEADKELFDSVSAL